MANTLPTTMEYFDNLLGEQLTEGGGGSSDFSTATITVNPTHKAVVTMPVIREDGVVEIRGIHGTSQFILGEQGTSIHIEVMSDDATITITGDYREVVEEGEVVEQIATGDCTITIS
jgi:glutamine phosphoribosylpyrophosphate amidotransferase